ncbi:extracellular solute-binding protein [Oscillatoria sp. FACHB-1407]|uniref:ABC transporter substrate-binding protein n=1 Tax=Oscillatoria sp. FACHB-1407 TaxID=2692847 RepID=UPI00168822DE|nr:extracellular solute-binding protein [Oscillatoria sp. FACHB-1407]MBD2459722.1 extracellular solute-binding protein [Oscillatoria sp. FACHB-1407]
MNNFKPPHPNFRTVYSGISRRKFIKYGALALGTGAIASCSGAPSETTSVSPSASASPAEEKILNVLAFSGYEEPGMLEPFEAATGIKVNLKIHDGSDDEMIALIKTSPAGTWDIMTPTSAYIPALAKEGVLMELNPSDYPLDSYLPPFDQWSTCFEGGKMYGLLNRFGYYGITYDSTKLQASEVESLDVLMDPKLQGKIALFDWFLPNMGVVAKWLGFNPPYQLTADQLAQVKEKLFALRPQVGLIGSTAQTTQALASGDFWVAIAGEFIQAGLAVEGKPFLASVPKEGGVTWDQAVIVLGNSPRPQNAVKFLQYVAGAEFQAKLAVARTYYSMVPNQDAAALLTNDQRKLLNLEDVTNFQQKFLANLSPRERPDNIDEWSAIWEEFKSL